MHKHIVFLTLIVLCLEKVCVVISLPVAGQAQSWQKRSMNVEAIKAVGMDWTLLPCLSESLEVFSLSTMHMKKLELGLFLVAGSVTAHGIMEQQEVKLLQTVLVRARIWPTE